MHKMTFWLTAGALVALAFWGTRFALAGMAMPGEASLAPGAGGKPAPQPIGETMITRIAEIEVHPQLLKEYLAAAATVGAESVAKEPGVICIFPMQCQEAPHRIRIVEIYRDEAAYQAHLATPHFKKYKEGTLCMVKSLALVPMRPLDYPNMSQIFRKQP